MGRSVTGGGLTGKDISKADVSVNIYCFLRAQKTQSEVEALCAIGDEYVTIKELGSIFKVPYETIVSTAIDYIRGIGGFEKFAEYGLIRPEQQ